MKEETAAEKRQIVVVGGPEFTVGFRIAGIRNVVDVSQSPDAAAAMRETMQNEKIGIIITDDRTINSLDEGTRETVEASVRPVTVVVSTEATAQETLRNMIIKSIGVDLWRD